MKSTQGAGLIGDEALDFLAILSFPNYQTEAHSNLSVGSGRLFENNDFNSIFR